MGEKFWARVAHSHPLFLCVLPLGSVSPWQKAEVVRLTRTFTNGITLAIGDGANDVGMIQVWLYLVALNLAHAVGVKA